jgi:O-succinylbenzoate synthase
MSLRADICRYGIPFSGPVTVRGVLLEQREGLLLHLCHEGAYAYGEIAPLAALHPESLDEALQALASFIPELARYEGSTPEEWQQIIGTAHLPPSVETGIEMALINLDAAETGSTPSFPGTFPPAPRIPVNALLAGTPTEVLERAAKRYREGFRAFKLKVRAGYLDDAVACIHTFHSEFGGKSELRLDANQSLSLDEAIRFGKALPKGFITYIEEPLQEASLIPEFHASTAIPSALDESLWQHPELLDQIGPKPLGALVIKPNCIGGIRKSLDLAGRADRMGLMAVFSSAFESSVSLGLYALMASVASPVPSASGLDTASFLSDDLTEHTFTASGGSVDPVAAWSNSLHVRPEMIETVESWIL